MISSNRTDSIAALCTVLLCAVLFLLFFGAQYFDPAHLLMDLGFDGFKNYYTFGYHVKHGHGFWFGGMAYPTGDNVIFADAQPVISILFQQLNKVFPWIGSHTALIINILILAGVALGGGVVFKIFRHYEVDVYPAIFFSVLIALFSPQILRMSLHHSLAYVFVIPTTLWVHLKAMQDKRPRFKFLALSLWGIFITFVHSYFLLMYGMYLGAYYFFRYLFDRKFRTWEYLGFISPFIIFLLYLWMFGGFSDRPDTAWGFFEYRAAVKDFFFPHSGPIVDYLNKQFPSLDLHFREGSSYIGIVGILGFIVLLYRVLRRKWAVSIHEKSSLLGLIPITLFALQIPFVWMGEELIKSIPVIQQFRGTGRFAWFFYYVIIIYGSIELLKTVYTLRNSKLRNVLLFALVCLFFAEVSFQLGKLHDGLAQYSGHDALERNDTISRILQQNGISPDSIKSVIAVPPSTTGSEKLRLYDDYQLKMEVWPFCMQTGIPATSINLSRTPVSTVLKTLALTCNEYTPKPAGLKIDAGKHLVVIKDIAFEEYAWLCSISTKLGEEGQLGVFMVNSNDLMKSRPVDRDLIKKNKSATVLLFDGFEELKGKGLQGNGLQIQEAEVQRNIPLIDSVGHVEVSFWYKFLPDKTSDVVSVSLDFQNAKGEVISSVSFSDRDLIKFEVLENWLRFAKVFPVPPGTAQVVLKLYSRMATIDNLMLRDIRDNVFFEEAGYLNFNNNLIPVKHQ